MQFLVWPTTDHFGDGLVIEMAQHRFTVLPSHHAASDYGSVMATKPAGAHLQLGLRLAEFRGAA